MVCKTISFHIIEDDYDNDDNDDKDKDKSDTAVRKTIPFDLPQ